MLYSTDSAPLDAGIKGGNAYSMQELQAKINNKQQTQFKRAWSSCENILTEIAKKTARNCIQAELTKIGSGIYCWTLIAVNSKGEKLTLVEQKLKASKNKHLKLITKFPTKESFVTDLSLSSNGKLIINKLNIPGNFTLKTSLAVEVHDMEVKGNAYLKSNQLIEFNNDCMAGDTLVIDADIKFNKDFVMSAMESVAIISPNLCDIRYGGVVAGKVIKIYAPKQFNYQVATLLARGMIDITLDSIHNIQLLDNYEYNLTYEALNASPQPYTIERKINVPHALYILAPKDCLSMGSRNTAGELLGSDDIFLHFKNAYFNQGSITAINLGVCVPELRSIGLAIHDELDANGYFNHRKFTLIARDTLILNYSNPVSLHGVRIKVLNGEAYIAAARLDMDSSELIINSNSDGRIPSTSFFAMHSINLFLPQANVTVNSPMWQDRSTPRFVELRVKNAIQNRSKKSIIYAYGHVMLPKGAAIQNFGGKIVGTFNIANINTREVVESRVLDQTLFGSTQDRKGRWDNWYRHIEDRVEVTSVSTPQLETYDSTTIDLGIDAVETRLEGHVLAAGNVNLRKTHLGAKEAKYNMNLAIAAREAEYEIDSLYTVSDGAYAHIASVAFMRQNAAPIDRIVLIDGKISRFAENELPYQYSLGE